MRILLKLIQVENQKYDNGGKYSYSYQFRYNHNHNHFSQQ